MHDRVMKMGEEAVPRIVRLLNLVKIVFAATDDVVIGLHEAGEKRMEQDQCDKYI